MCVYDCMQISQHLHEQGQQLLRFKQTYQPLPDPPHISHLNDMGFTYQDWCVQQAEPVPQLPSNRAPNIHESD